MLYNICQNLLVVILIIFYLANAQEKNNQVIIDFNYT